MNHAIPVTSDNPEKVNLAFRDNFFHGQGRADIFVFFNCLTEFLGQNMPSQIKQGFQSAAQTRLTGQGVSGIRSLKFC